MRDEEVKWEINMLILFVVGLLVVHAATFAYICEVHDRLKRTEEGLKTIGKKYDMWK
jgi:hypothetical protein